METYLLPPRWGLNYSWIHLDITYVYISIFQYLWKKTQLDRKIPIPWCNAYLTEEKDLEKNHLEKLKSAYSKVRRTTLIRVYEAYKLDYELFGYDFNQVLMLAGYEPLSIF